MKIRTKLILSFGVIIGILCIEIALNQTISNNAAETYQKLKTQVLPALRILDKFESINNEVFLLISNKVHHSNFPSKSQNRLSGILEVELPYLKTELLLLSENLEENNEVALKAPVIIELTNELIDLSNKINNLLVLKSDYTNSNKMQAAVSLVEEDISKIHAQLDTSLLLLKIDFGNLLEGYQNKFVQSLKSLSNIILITGLLGILFGIAVAIVVIRSIAKPIKTLNKAALKVSRGDYDADIFLKGKDELASLGDSFNIMTSSLRSNFRLIESNNEEIKQQEEKIRKVIEASPAAIILMDPQKKISLINAQTEHLFGYSRDELIGHSAEELIPSRFLKQKSIIDTVFSSKNKIEALGINQDFYGITKLKEEVPIEISLSFIEIQHQDMILASIVDITERKQQETEIKKYVDQLKSKNKELEQFSYITSHDLQEPLRTVLSFIDLIQEDYSGKLDNDMNIYLKFIADASTRMSKLIKSLLDYSRIGHKGIVGTVNCNILLDNVSADLKYKIEKAQAEIYYKDLPTIKGFDLELRLLFQNLITNAIKFQKKAEVPKIHISSEDKRTHWQFNIADNGIGIREEFQNKIFVIFQRLHNREEYDGTGIGLSHCQKIVELHGGEIWVNSEAEVGSTFHFTIPKTIK
ncbi:PAS domain S-box-containing protein [Gillisia sp. Hel_I_86]|uniref:sensor histidine kinase n=1 Tax=Gillisia sp. Hel_I_86 TaxID=1249981 RepID=UPI001198CFD1|nr:ATP-binding protein [Gillisia sp. Hel_I_86]TVZ28452.1 PAS domain S-box-containing protein [Gillisia sp. Hel_I_86]